MSVSRPALRYHGAKWRLAPWIVEHLPSHRTYVEPFGGGAGVLLRKPASYAEVYNDLDGEIVNYFRVLRDHGDELKRLIELTPYAREEFDIAYQPTDDPIEQARRTCVRAWMGHGSAGTTKQTTGFRCNATRSYTTPCMDWAKFPEAMAALTERMRRVVIENRPALNVIERYDSPETCFYVDPPYLSETRCDRGGRRDEYRHEMTDKDHLALLARLKEVKGCVILSGYPNKMYDHELAGWSRFDLQGVPTDRHRLRTESLWLNPYAAKIRSSSLLSLA
jgi:DNA adenine methylase